MSWEHWLFVAFAAAAVGAAFYFSMRAEPPPSKKTEAKEPFFASRAASPSAPSSASSAEEQKSPPPPPQGALPMADFTPPPLPEPDESLLPLDMCFAARLFGESPSPAAAVEELRAQMRPAKSKNCYRLGFDESAEQWRMEPDMPSRYWIVAVPLADRGGPIDESDIRRIEDAARAFAQKAKMRPLFPSTLESLANAARIDKFCATADMFIELRLSGGACTEERAGEVMRLAGMTADGARGYVRRMNSEELFRGRVMPAPASASRRTIVFEMDAPNITAPPRAFEEMLRAVRRAAHLLNMQITDPKGETVDDERAAAMSRQLSLLAAQMREFGAAPGGAIARLIFS